MKAIKILLSLALPIFILLFAPSKSFAASEFKPQLNWQRSTEAQDKVVTETSVGSKVEEALQLPLDSNQIVFDNGISTPQAL